MKLPCSIIFVACLFKQLLIQMWSISRLLYQLTSHCHGNDSYLISTTAPPLSTQGKLKALHANSHVVYFLNCLVPSIGFCPHPVSSTLMQTGTYIHSALHQFHSYYRHPTCGILASCPTLAIHVCTLYTVYSQIALCDNGCTR